MTLYNLRVLQLSNKKILNAELEKIGADPALTLDRIAKSTLHAIKLEQIPPRVARFLYQELILEGGETVLPAHMDERVDAPVDILLLGTRYQLQHIAIRIRTQSETELDLLADDLERVLDSFMLGARGSLTVRNTQFDWGKRTYVMGILNVTPDSFSGDGVMASSTDFIASAVAHAEELVAAGADILDIGGESTRPGSAPTTAEQEQQRVIPVIQALRDRIRVPISIDTYRAETARLALDSGADIVNDVWGLRMDAEMKNLVAQRGVPIVIMHNRSKPKDAVQSERLGSRYVGVEYNDLLADVIRELRAQVELGLDAGIAPEKIIVDPGIGFGKTVEQNIELLNRLSEFRALGYPILLGPSRKGFIGFTLDLPTDQRVEGTIATVVLGIERGADIVRVHDVKAVARAAKMTDAIVR
ncbi:MAG: dihydropteroate synthase [Chloroflexi bacterium]|nr:dihydropteroate synthase [Chloroflexota bacterium]